MNNDSVYQVPDSKFIKVVSRASNIRQALLELGLKAKGGNYKTLKSRCKKLGIEPPKISSINQRDIRNNLYKTLKSRCKIFHFSIIDNDSLYIRLKYILKCENKDISNDILLNIIKDSDGDFRKAINEIQLY